MQKRTKRLAVGTLAGVATFAATGSLHAAILADGTLSSGEGYTLEATQTNVTNSPDGVDIVGAGNTNPLTQLSNVYASISGSGPTATLNVFVGGSVSQSQDTNIDLALQTNGTGVSSLASSTINGEGPQHGLQDISFDTGFKPNAYFILNLNNDQNGGSGNGLSVLTATFTDLSGNNAADPVLTGVLNNALVTTAVGAGGTGDPGFAGASTGMEFTIPLATLGYTDGTNIEALLFPSVGGDNRTNNQILSPFNYPVGGFDSNNNAYTDSNINLYDYTYYDTKEGSESGRQFTGPAYAGNQYFTIAGAAVPEPASISLIGLASFGLLGRRSRKA